MIRVALLAFLALFHLSPWAQECPGQMRIVVGFSAGGGADLQARLIAERLGPRLGKTIIVENRTGAGGNLAQEFVAKAAPDGCTLLLTGNNHHMNPMIYARAGYDSQNDFAPVLRTVEALIIVSANVGQPFRNLAGLVDYARANPGKLSYGTSGIGSVNHIAGELLRRAARIEMVHVPYKGAVQAIADAVAGTIPLNVGSVTAAQPHIAAGKLVGLAITGNARSSALPDVPTMAEAGYPAATFVIWNGIFAPARTPLAWRERLNTEIRAIMDDKALRERMAAQGWVVGGGTVADFDTFLAEDYRNSRKIVTDLKLKSD